MSVSRLPLLLVAPALAAALGASGSTAPAGSRASSFRLWFRGAVGSSATIRMELAREGDRLTGRYYHETRGKDLALAGTVREDGTAECEETAGRQVTGTFRGKLVERAGTPPLLAFEGSWSRPGGSSAIPFAVVEESPQLPAEFRPLADVARQKFANGGSAEAVFPRIAGTRAPGVVELNALVREAVTKAIADDGRREIRVSYAWDHLSAGLASVALSTWVYDGVSHGSQVVSSVNVDLRTGRAFRALDLFRPGPDGPARLSRACVARLKERLGPEADARWIEQGAAPGGAAYGNAGVSAAGVVVRFPPSSVAPWASGAQEVTVPWEELSAVLLPESPVSPLVAARLAPL